MVLYREVDMIRNMGDKLYKRWVYNEIIWGHIRTGGNEVHEIFGIYSSNIPKKEVIKGTFLYYGQDFLFWALFETDIGKIQVILLIDKNGVGSIFVKMDFIRIYMASIRLDTDVPRMTIRRNGENVSVLRKAQDDNISVVQIV